MPIYVGIDFGSTNTRVASTENLQQILRINKFSTSSELITQQNKLAESILEVCEGNSPDFIGVGIHGLINKQSKKYVKMPNYSVLNNKTFDSLLGGAYPLSKLIVENDAVCGALGEAVFGSGQDYKRVVYITLSTGVGGALVVDKKIDSSATYEPGHHIINFDSDIKSGSNILGEFEAYCSGNNFENVYGISSEECNDKNIWDKYGTNLSVGLHNVIQFWSPDVIVIGGGIGFNHFDEYYDSLLSGLNKTEFTKIPDIVKCDLDDDSGIYGSFVLLDGQLNNI